MDKRYMVKQYLTRLVKADGRVWDVYNTGESGCLLFAAIVGTDRLGMGGYEGGLHIPIYRKDLLPEISRMIPRA